MTIEEFSNEFDALVTTMIDLPISSFNEYEKSIFLTQAQESLIKEYYSNSLEGFETTEEGRRALSSLVKTDKLDPIGVNSPLGVSDKSYFFKLKDDVWYITFESARASEKSNCYPDGKDMVVTPVSQDQYHKIKNNPFRGPNNRQVIRLDIDNNMVELVSKTPISSYIVRYVSKPTPIILVNLSDDNLSIDGEFKPTECKLDKSLHRAILGKAVALAISSKLKSKES